MIGLRWFLTYAVFGVALFGAATCATMQHPADYLAHDCTAQDCAVVCNAELRIQHKQHLDTLAACYEYQHRRFVELGLVPGEE